MVVKVHWYLVVRLDRLGIIYPASTAALCHRLSAGQVLARLCKFVEASFGRSAAASKLLEERPKDMSRSEVMTRLQDTAVK